MGKRGVSKAQWLESALEVLAAEGIEAVKIGRLAQRLGIARSGFYWHFEDRDDLLNDMLAYWEHEYTEVVMGDAAATSGTPADRLLRVIEMVDEYGLADLDLAVCAWADRDPRARDAFDRIYGRRREFVGSIFADQGFTGRDLEMRTRLFVAYTSWQNRIFGAPGPEAADNNRRQVDILTSGTNGDP